MNTKRHTARPEYGPEAAHTLEAGLTVHDYRQCTDYKTDKQCERDREEKQSDVLRTTNAIAAHATSVHPISDGMANNEVDEYRNDPEHRGHGCDCTAPRKSAVHANRLTHLKTHKITHHPVLGSGAISMQSGC
jgi:hypothetical protein